MIWCTHVQATFAFCQNYNNNNNNNTSLIIGMYVICF